MFTPQRLADGKIAVSGGAPVGIGWRIDRDEQGRRRFHHGGSLTGGGAIVLALPEHRVAAAIVTNQLPQPTEAVASQIASLVRRTLLTRQPHRGVLAPDAHVRRDCAFAGARRMR